MRFGKQRVLYIQKLNVPGEIEGAMESSYKFISKTSGGIVAALSLVAAVLGITQFFDNRVTVDLSGEWRLEFVINSTSYKPYEGLEVGYKVYVSQKNALIEIAGEKWWENGEELPFDQHVQIELDGSIEGDQLPLAFTLFGELRKTVGYLDTSIESNKLIKGTFFTTGANSSGTVTMVKAR